MYRLFSALLFNSIIFEPFFGCVVVLPVVIEKTLLFNPIVFNLKNVPIKLQLPV